MQQPLGDGGVVAVVVAEAKRLRSVGSHRLLRPSPRPTWLPNRSLVVAAAAFFGVVACCSG